MEDLVLLERRPDGVAVVTLNNPKVNALSQAMLARIKEIALDLTANPPGAVVITGGERIFAAGADISEFGGTAEGDRIGLGFHSALDAVAAIPRFVIWKRLSPSNDLSSNVTVPLVGAYTPVITLKHVVFPAPFGPMRPRISPLLI